LNKQENIDISVLKELSVLYVEDDDALRSGMLKFFRMIFDRVYSADNGKTGLEAFHKHSPGIVVTDIKMPIMDGLEMSREIKQQSPGTPIIITTAFSETDYLLKAIEIGVDRYVQKPVDQDLLTEALFKCGLPLIQEHRIENLDHTIHKSLEKQLGNSPVMKEVIKGMRQVAGTGFSVVLQGETGVGKSLVAGIIHDLSPRADFPFVTVDVGSIPELLVESELFGHKKGSFTGAIKDKKGLLETAGGGTVFLDELANMSLHVQSKFLRAVEERKVYPVGAVKPVDIDVRIVSAVNVDFKKIVAEKQFREDLYYRLNEFDIVIPALRDRPGDIPLLAQRFVTGAARELNKKIIEITPGAMELLEKHPWPGNVRQLKNIMRRAVLLCETNVITPGDIKKLLKPVSGKGTMEEQGGLPPHMQSLALEDVEKWAILEALKQTGGKRMKATEILKIDYKRLTRKMEKYNISVS
jgi:DNA-binding NtrC family response regulator